MLQAHRERDRVAGEIVTHAAHEVALLAVTLGKSLAFPDGRMPLALAGGLLVHEAEFRAMVLRRIRRRCPVGKVVVVDDAALCAARAAVRWERVS